MRVTVIGYVTYGRPWTRTIFRGEGEGEGEKLHGKKNELAAERGTGRLKQEERRRREEKARRARRKS